MEDSFVWQTRVTHKLKDSEMSLIELERNEKELIRNAIKKRIGIYDNNPDFYDKHKKDLLKILNQLDH